MSKEYEKPCSFCKVKIRMSDKDGSWKAYDLNNGLHNCQKKQEPTTQQQIEKQNQRTTLTVDEIVRRLKSIGIDIDFDTFLRSTNQK